MTYVDAIYWTVMTLTTVGYGDLTALSPQGRALEMVRACVRAWVSYGGMALIAWPRSCSGVGRARYWRDLGAGCGRVGDGCGREGVQERGMGVEERGMGVEERVWKRGGVRMA